MGGLVAGRGRSGSRVMLSAGAGTGCFEVAVDRDRLGRRDLVVMVRRGSIR